MANESKPRIIFLNEMSINGGPIEQAIDEKIKEQVSGSDFVSEPLTFTGTLSNVQKFLKDYSEERASNVSIISPSIVSVTIQPDDKYDADGLIVNATRHSLTI